GVEVFRATAAAGPFTQVATVARDVNIFTDSDLTPSTQYFYQVVATNQVGDSAASNTASARTRIAKPVVQVTDVCVGSISLKWTATANDRYTIERSTDGTTFTLVATLPASQTTFHATGVANGGFLYRVTAFSGYPEGSDWAVSDVAGATIGPINVTHFVSPGNPGFTDPTAMLANGSAQFTTENLLRLNN